MKFQLDFSIENINDRLNFVRQNICLSELTRSDVELCSNYILYGKEKNGKSIVDDKKIFIKTKFNSYSKREPSSLEALMESPTFDEESLTAAHAIYKKPKRTIDRDNPKHAAIPGMKELWEQIDQLDHTLKLAKGEIEPQENENVPQLDSRQLYHLNHTLISLRKDQYHLLEPFLPRPLQHFGSFYESPVDKQMCYPVLPCGIPSKEDDTSWKNPYGNSADFKGFDIEHRVELLVAAHKPFFNFLDKNHIYYLCLNYYNIKMQIENQPDSPLHGLIWALDFYVEKAKLSEQQKLILEGKKARLQNKEICKVLEKQLGISHQENYVSTIWNKTCQLIADAADLHFDEWCCKNYKNAWKRCSCCGEMVLKDSRNFVKKAKSADGFTNRCKKCDAKKRRGEI